VRNAVARFLVTAAVLLGVWWVLSGRFDLLHFGTGVLAALVIAADVKRIQDRTRFRPLRFLLFLPWLFVQIVISNLRVARMVLDPRMPIAPAFIRQAPGVVGERALTTLGCSVTLTPGTLTVDVTKEEIFVHALDRKSARDTRAGLVARRVARVFEARSP
jgi:multicomponent Na+:H+ antiporter subunit E